MILSFSKMCAVIDAKVAKLTHIKYIIAFVTISINNTVRLYLLTYYRQ